VNKRAIKDLIKKLPGALFLHQQVRTYQGARRVFTKHYDRNSWGSLESSSGLGSTLEYTEKLRRELPRLLADFKIRTIFDAPCGDYNWFRLIERKGIRYIGADVVAALIKKNRALYSAIADTEFIELDITKDALPDADLWLCRDCLFHFSDADISKTLANLQRSHIPYFLTTTYASGQNRDIATGGFRFLNLEAAPFHFPKAITYIDDWVDGWRERRLGLWDRRALESVLRRQEGGLKVSDRI
jgi:SAM-dependent methyltransferase